MAVLLSELARRIDGQLHGDGSIAIVGADTLRDARPGEITFVESARLTPALTASQAAAAIVPRDLRPDGLPFIAVDDVHEAFALVVTIFRPQRTPQRVGVSPAAVVSPTARLGADVDVHPNAVIGEDVEIGAGSTVHSGVQIMAGCKIGERAVLFPNAVLYENTVIGRGTIVHAGAVIGAYGFGYNTVAGRHELSAQLGNVVIGDDVEIGACTTVDRGTYGSTVIGDGTKIDNQVMIAHNCRIGKHNIICSQVGVAGSSTTGDYVVMAGQVGVRDHVHIGDGATLGAKAGVMNHVPAGQAYVGIPATPERQQMLIQAALMKLPELKKHVRALQRAMDQLESHSSEIARQEAA